MKGIRVLMKKSKTTVLVGRKWHEPEISISVGTEGIGISLSLEDFLKALAQEVGNPSFVVTIKGLEKRLLSASEAVVAGMKEETVRVM
jgi:hypothetical protein